jgi:NADH dehydrogenase
MSQELHCITGAFGYSGKYMARRLLDQGVRVRTLTNKPRPADAPRDIEAIPFHFQNPAQLARDLEGVDVLYNTYWVRFNHGDRTYGMAVENTRRLFRAAQQAGVKRVVHVSITSPAENSPLPYFKGKAELERDLRESGMSYAILRPTVLFGPEDILINNIAWILRRLPVVGVPGGGGYKVQPVFVDDLAALAVTQGAQRGNVTMDAVGPEIFTYRELVCAIRDAMGLRTPVLPMPAWVVLAASKILGRLVGDVVLTDDEVRGLSAGLLWSRQTPTCRTRITDWLGAHAQSLGGAYANEIKRHYVRREVREQSAERPRAAV